MCRAGQKVVQASLDAPAQARNFLLAHLNGELAESVHLDDAVLVVTELVTNAVNAGSAHLVVEVDLRQDHLLIAVADDAPGSPRLQEPATFSTHGRGLRIVDTIARRWGTDQQTQGKRVWAELPIDQPGA